jgi:hypothetical protein
MKITADAKEEHKHRALLIVNQLAEEYGAWYGWTSGFGRTVALGEYILEITESEQFHDEWLMAARKAFLKWKEVHDIETTPPPDLRAK